MTYPIYLDYNATTPVDKRVLAEMLPYFTEHFGNAASRTHLYGWTAEEAVAKARLQVASLLGADAKEIVFTSGATESNNLAIKGVSLPSLVKKSHIITIATEHKAVLDTCQHVALLGVAVTYLSPNADGLVSVLQIENAITPQTVLVSVMYANNETGVLMPIAEIGHLCRNKGICFHTDATQATGKIMIDVERDNIDILSLSAHKMYGPKGIGALYVRKNINVVSQIDGGKHERGRRSGTLNVTGIVGLGKACEIAKQEMNAEKERLEKLRNILENELTKLPNTWVNGSNAPRLAHVSNITFVGRDGEDMLMKMNKIAVSNGSACTSASILPSHVLKAMGLSDDDAHSSIRFSLGRFTTDKDIEEAIACIRGVLRK
jgi:cysteine desulfurase